MARSDPAPADRPHDSPRHRLDTARVFRALADHEFSLDVQPADLEFRLSRLRRSSQELWGELRVTARNGHFPRARTIDGILSTADMNLSSATARTTRAKLLAERCGPEGGGLDWVGFMEELAVKAIEYDRRGEPAVILADFPISASREDTWAFEGFPVLKRHPTVLFGPGGACKSLFALWIAGQIAQTAGPVLYCDWELSGEDHRSRLERLFPAPPRGLHYVCCRVPLRDQMDRLTRLISTHQAVFAIFDSIGPASRAGSRFMEGDLGQEYFGLVRQLGIGTLHVAHPPKHVEDEKVATIWGSGFFGYLARSIWFVQATENNPADEVMVGFYHHKMTTGQKLAPRAYRVQFRSDRTTISGTEIKAIDELVAKLPLLDRVRQRLQAGAATVKDLATALNVPVGVLRTTLAKHSGVFVWIDKQTVGLAAGEELF